VRVLVLLLSGAVGALLGMGLSKEDTHFYAEVLSAGILVTAKAEDTPSSTGDRPLPP
jgi:hypothetical protein